MEAAELQATQMKYDNDMLLKEQQLRSKMQQEVDALLQRAHRGREEMKITWQQDLERRTQRFRNVIQELENIQRLETVQLNYFLEQQTVAGKRQHVQRGGRAGIPSLPAAHSTNSIRSQASVKSMS